MNVDICKKDPLFHEVNFDALPNQSNIYGVTCIEGPDQCANKILVSLTKGRIFACEYNKANGNSEIKSKNQEVTFTYIPGKCFIISIDSFMCSVNGLIIGVTFCKEANENFLNIYCNYDDESGQGWSIDDVARNNQSFDLEFTPYQLSHYKVKSLEENEQTNVFILLGSDQCFHVYAQTKTRQFSSEPVDKYFPELLCDCVPTYLDMTNLENDHRFTIVGSENGKMYAFLINTESNSIVSSWNIEHDSPIAQCQIFKNSLCNSLHVVVVSAREPSVIYENIQEDGFSKQVLLEQSDKYDCSTCCAVADINYDGKPEIIIGTYGQTLLCYSYNSNASDRSIQPIWTRSFAFPIIKVVFIDMTGDGIDEMVVISTKGIHILQPNLALLLQKCRSKLLNLANV